MEIALPILGKSAAGSIIGKLLTAATSYLNEQYFWKTNLEGEINSLHHLLPQIQAVVDFAERKPITDNESLVKWLWQFRDGIDEAEEVLDDLEYIQLEKIANTDKPKLSRAVDTSIRTAKRVLKLDDVLKGLKKCVQNLSSIALGAGHFFRLVKELDGSGSSEDYLHQQLHPVAGERITTSLPGSTLFQGREKEKQIIIQTLMGESQSNTWNVQVLPLVGMGGIGKTALAQQVYKHFEDVKHFDVRIWVCVSTDFNVVSLTMKILESVTGVRSDYKNLDKLQTKIREVLQAKRFLLVLDDAWNDNQVGDWERLCAPLHHGQKGSWILLTTRSSSVVKKVSMVMRGTIEQMNLGGLSNDKCRSLLYHYAFAPSEDADAHPHLRSVGEEIIAKLQGIPLLAKTIGGVLNSKLDLEHWIRVLENEVWEMPQNSKEDFIPALKLSYYMLSVRLKRCFAFCSLFPPDYMFEKKKLVNMWVAAGLIQPLQSEGLEDDIAEECFDMLYIKSFFDVEPYHLIEHYIMHDMLHGLACHVSHHECCRIIHEQPKGILNTVRHLSITCTLDELPEKTKMVGKLRHLRTLFIDYYGYVQSLHDFIQETCTSLRSIRVLVIEFHGTISSNKRVLKKIGNLVNLRYVKLSQNDIFSKLPKSFCRLYFLQVLDIDCMGLPSGMNKLINLKHFRVLSTMFRMGKLTRLQELNFYQVGTKNGYRIDELKDMNDLRQLEIFYLGNVQSFEEAKGANLQMKKKLRTLRLHWQFDGPTNNSDHEHDNQVLAALNPPPHIRELTIRCYGGSKSAPWMSTPSLFYLQSLDICSCPGWEELPPLWELPHLKHLNLIAMDVVRRFGPESSNSNEVYKPLFPSLETLVVQTLPRWQEWDDADVYIWFPHLRNLKILGCRKLRKIPCLPFSLKKFCMDVVGLASLPRSYMTYNDPRTRGRFRELMSLQFLKICECPEILYRESIGEEEDGNLLPSSLTELEIVDVNGDGLCKYLQGLTMLSRLKLDSCRGMAAFPPADHLTALQRLSLYECKDLVSLGGLHSITLLRELEIRNCPKLLEGTVDDTHYYANNLLPASLTDLEFTGCNVCHESLSQCLQGLTSLSSLKILDCPKILSLPKAELLHHLTALEQLGIDKCDELLEVESLSALASLKSLRISRCPKLLAAASSTQQPSTDKQRETNKEKGTLHSLQRIETDSILYLLNLPVPKGIVSICNSYYYNEDYQPKFNLIPHELEEWLLQCCECLQDLELGGVPYLQSLPASLESFSSLKSLSLSSAHQLKSLPRMPASLEKLSITGCNPRLKKRCQENTGDDWPNIKHIPEVEIDTDGSDEI